MDSSPTELLTRLRAGDPEAGREICRIYLPVLRGIALAGTLNAAAATEATKTALGNLLGRLAEAEGPADLIRLAEESGRAAAKAVIDGSGGRSTELVGLPSEIAARAAGPNPDLPAVFDGIPPDRVAWMLLEAASWIPAKYEVPFLLRYLEGFSYSRIAELAGTEEREVGAALTAARRLFQREFTFHMKKLANP